MYYADAMAFLGEQGGPIVVEDDLKLNLAHLTAAPPWLADLDKVLAAIESFKKQISSEPPTSKLGRNDLVQPLQLVQWGKELEIPNSPDKTFVILGLQNFPRLNFFEDYLTLFQTGIRIICLAYKEKNWLGTGWENAGLGLEGVAKNMLEEIASHKKKMIIDLSHSGHQTAREALAFIKSENLSLGVMASHGCCYMKYHHVRNLPDDVLRSIVDLGGLVGITPLTFAADETDNSLEPFKKHLTHALNLCGRNSVCLGTDACYIYQDPVSYDKRFTGLKNQIDPLGLQGARSPEQPVQLNRPDLMTVLEKELKFLGSELEAVMFTNFFRFLNTNLPTLV